VHLNDRARTQRQVFGAKYACADFSEQ